MPPKYRSWSREEYDQLEALLKRGLTYATAAAEMGRERLSVQGAVQRIGLMSPERQGWRKRKDWAQIDVLLAECIEARLMTVPQAAAHISALVAKTSASSIYERLKGMPELKKRARMNAQRRMPSVCRRIHLAGYMPVRKSSLGPAPSRLGSSFHRDDTCNYQQRGNNAKR